MISNKLFVALKTSPVPNYKLAQAVGVHPNWVAKVLHGAVKIKPGDPRILKIGDLLGLRPQEIFEKGSE